MTDYICESCQKGINESESHHKYQEDAAVICDECHKYYKHEIGETG